MGTVPVSVHVDRNIGVSTRSRIIDGIHGHQMLHERYTGTKHEKLSMGAEAGTVQGGKMMHLARTQTWISFLHGQGIGCVCQVNDLCQIQGIHPGVVMQAVGVMPLASLVFHIHTGIEQPAGIRWAEPVVTSSVCTILY